MSENVAADVFLLAAGFGTRLKPQTDTTPKPLLPVAGRPLIDWNLSLIARSGFPRVIINLHHLGDQIIAYVGDGSRWGLEVVYSKEDPILDTGGGIKNIEHLLRHEHLVTINSDILIGGDFSLRDFAQNHLARKEAALVHMLLRVDPKARNYGSLGTAEDGRVLSFLGKQYQPGVITEERMFTGIQILQRGVFAYMPPKGSVFSITRDTLVKVLVDEQRVDSTRYDGYWSDMGTPEQFSNLPKNLLEILSR